MGKKKARPGAPCSAARSAAQRENTLVVPSADHRHLGTASPDALHGPSGISAGLRTWLGPLADTAPRQNGVAQNAPIAVFQPHLAPHGGKLAAAAAGGRHRQLVAPSLVARHAWLEKNWTTVGLMKGPCSGYWPKQLFAWSVRHAHGQALPFSRPAPSCCASRLSSPCPAPSHPAPLPLAPP